MLRLLNIIIPHLSELFEFLGQNDKLVEIKVDEAFDEALILKFIPYTGCDYYKNGSYEMRAIIGEDRIIYENAVNGVDFRDFLENWYVSEEDYDKIMSL